MAQKHVKRLRVVGGLVALLQLIGGAWVGYTTGLLSEWLPIFTLAGAFVGLLVALAVLYVTSAAIYLVEAVEANQHRLSQLKSEMSVLAPRIRDLVVDALDDEEA